ncbi:type VII secretion integral membrane protein EccD, partial [Mycobacterium basiliense]
ACAPPGALSAAHGLIGVVVAIQGAIAIGVLTKNRWQTAVVTVVVTVCGVLAGVAAIRMFRPVSLQVLALCVLVGLLVLVRMTPTIALWVARVRPPHFGSITGRDLFARREGMPVDTVSPVSEDSSEDEDNELTDITARGAAIAASARLVNAVQAGICVGVSAILPAAVWGVLAPGRAWAWLALLVAGLVVGLFVTQGRGFAAKYQAVALVCGAAAAVCAGILKYALAAPKGVPGGLLWPATAAAAFAALGLAAALLVPATRFRPLIRLTVEWIEVLAMIVLLPAAAALGGLFSWLRH